MSGKKNKPKCPYCGSQLAFVPERLPMIKSAYYMCKRDPGCGFRYTGTKLPELAPSPTESELVKRVKALENAMSEPTIQGVLYELFNVSTEEVDGTQYMETAEAISRNSELRLRSESTRWILAPEEEL